MPNSINYFKYFPTTVYHDKTAVNITRRTKIVQQLYSSPLSFFSYTIKEGERPEDIALFYYGDIGKVWLIFLANNIIDPASEWPLNSTDFDKMLVAKYKNQAKEYGYVNDYDIISWTMSTNTNNNILYYENAEGLQLTKDTFTLNQSLGLISTEDLSKWVPIRIYDHEVKLNAEKRNIFIFNKNYAAQAETELKELLSV